MVQSVRSKRAVGQTTLVRMRARGVVALPPEMREHQLFSAVKRPDGVIELRPQQTVDASQAWFWTDRWQKMEREAQEDIDAGRVRSFDDTESFIKHLESQP